MPMIELYQQFTCTHDYFHETEIHRQDVIYKSHYGSFLQAFQCHIKLKGITGNVAKKVKHHERFLMLTYNAHLRVRMKQYLTQCAVNKLARNRGESNPAYLMRVNSDYQLWCGEFDEGLDEPSIASNRFIKYVESYKRCVDGVRKWNTWLLEVEAIDWMGAYHLSGKKNYVNEGCHRIDTLYGGRLTEDELEWRRVNQFFLMTEGKGAMSLD